ncbi:hypothetical protein [Bifidobacterium tissieri]|uniref:hypothetical protein n=1 Tax=Bifidobacterium tissieri TaxID=1630162 RepID=UPI00123AD8F9|nr:hypothetical protein [Bifidobacterium tissieri]KAA8828689.1 hypothetical protein EM849_11670 [Bifidobacterium tissieri]
MEKQTTTVEGRPMVTYVVREDTRLIEVRHMMAPEGLSWREAITYAEEHGTGDLVDIEADESTVIGVEKLDGGLLPGSSSDGMVEGVTW